MSNRTTGKCKWFDSDKGFGFIDSKFDEDVFIHYSEIDSEGFVDLEEGDRVEFEPKETEDGLQAHKLIQIA